MFPENSEISVFKNINSDFYNFTVFVNYQVSFSRKFSFPFVDLWLYSGLELSHGESRIANRDKFPEIRGEDCDPFRVIRGKYFLSMNITLYIF